MKKNYILILFAVLFSGLNAQILSEDFDDFDSLFSRPTHPWIMYNFSQNNFGLGWFEGDSSSFSAFNGDSNAYAASNFQIGDDTGSAELSGILITPIVNIKNGDSITFYSRVATNTAGSVTFADRLIIRINTVDAGADSVADMGDGKTFLDKYDSVLVDINPTLSTAPFPAGMSVVWEKYTVIINKLTGANTRPSRIAFHYYNQDGGFAGSHSNYLGIDAVRITTSGGASSLNKTNTLNKISIYPNPAQNYIAIKGFSGNVKASILTLDGRLIKSEVISNNGKIDIENLALGFYNLKIENGIETIYKKISKR